MKAHYLWASAIALELTLLHNFAWHLRFTSGDRAHPISAFSRLLRFHLFNGLISLLGNLILMRVLVQSAKLPVLPANAIAILCCAVLNFCAGNRFVFTEASRIKPQSPSRPTSTISHATRT